MKHTFPWPNSELNPNSRCHFRKKASIKKKQRAEFNLLTTRFKLDNKKPIKMIVIFYPPDRRGRDLDNCLASLKSGIDGMCYKLGINDKYLRPITIDWGEVVKYGKVEIELIIAENKNME